ncbi:MAG: hypothetical protein ACXW4K_11025 [Candidatus Deferrimicrobiaceae bacterium]
MDRNEMDLDPTQRDQVRAILRSDQQEKFDRIQVERRKRREQPE